MWDARGLSVFIDCLHCIETRQTGLGYRQARGRNVERTRPPRYNRVMIETLYKTNSPEKGKSECYVLVLAKRAGSEHGRYTFMEEHGRWDNDTMRFLHQVTFINADKQLSHQDALAMYRESKQRLAESGFVHSFVLDLRSKYPSAVRPSEPVEAMA